VRKVESGSPLSDKEIKDIITALKKYRNENIRLKELIPGKKLFVCLHLSG
jgi:F0F1-type ATP synthase delta subunit